MWSLRLSRATVLINVAVMLVMLLVVQPTHIVAWGAVFDQISPPFLLTIIFALLFQRHLVATAIFLGLTSLMSLYALIMSVNNLIAPIANTPLAGGSGLSTVLNLGNPSMFGSILFLHKQIVLIAGFLIAVALWCINAFSQSPDDSSPEAVRGPKPQPIDFQSLADRMSS